MPLVIVGIGIIALLILIMGFKLNTFISLIIVSFGVALALGMPFGYYRKTIGSRVRWNIRSLGTNIWSWSDARKINCRFWRCTAYCHDPCE